MGVFHWLQQALLKRAKRCMVLSDLHCHTSGNEGCCALKFKLRLSLRPSAKNALHLSQKMKCLDQSKLFYCVGTTGNWSSQWGGPQPFKAMNIRTSTLGSDPANSESPTAWSKDHLSQWKGLTDFSGLWIQLLGPDPKKRTTLGWASALLFAGSMSMTPYTRSSTEVPHTRLVNLMQLFAGIRASRMGSHFDLFFWYITVVGVTKVVYKVLDPKIVMISVLWD